MVHGARVLQALANPLRLAIMQEELKKKETI